MEMDAQTKARYHAWMMRRIIRRVVIPGVALLLILIGLIFSLRSCGREEDVEDDDVACVVQGDGGECLDEQTPDEESVPVASSNRPLTYQDFDFTVYDASEIRIVDTTYLGSYLVLVNKVFQLPEDYSPHDLVVPSVLAVWGHENVSLQLRATAARAIEDLFEEAYESSGLELWAVSGYRSFEDQVTRHQFFVDTYGEEEAQQMSARAGHSEHQTGLAMDVSAASVGGMLTEEFSNAPEGVWLRENAHRFGFVIRYPYSRRGLTGINYEPWHLRYVGIEPATQLFNENMVLEQLVLPVARFEQP